MFDSKKNACIIFTGDNFFLLPEKRHVLLDEFDNLNSEPPITISLFL